MSKHCCPNPSIMNPRIKIVINTEHLRSARIYFSALTRESHTKNSSQIPVFLVEPKNSSSKIIAKSGICGDHMSLETADLNPHFRVDNARCVIPAVEMWRTLRSSFELK